MFRLSKVKTTSIKPQAAVGKVLLLGGCVQPTLAPNINHSVKNILAKLVMKALKRHKKECCGAVDQHLCASKDALIKNQNIILTNGMRNSMLVLMSLSQLPVVAGSW